MQLGSMHSTRNQVRNEELCKSAAYSWVTIIACKL